MLQTLGIISSPDLSQSLPLSDYRTHIQETPYGLPSAPLQCAQLGQQPVVLLRRHGVQRSIPPHTINYRANVWALQAMGVQQVIGITTVGGIHQDLSPGMLCIADQVIDYTSGREHTYACSFSGEVGHVEFGQPYCAVVREGLMQAARQAEIVCRDSGVYGATQGPRLETAAEIRRMRQDGCDMVGMTGMPEASLAREMGLRYANLSLVVNWAAGLGTGPIDLHQIQQVQTTGISAIVQVLQAFCDAY